MLMGRVAKGAKSYQWILVSRCSRWTKLALPPKLTLSCQSYTVSQALASTLPDRTLPLSPPTTRTPLPPPPFTLPTLLNPRNTRLTPVNPPPPLNPFPLNPRVPPLFPATILNTDARPTTSAFPASTVASRTPFPQFFAVTRSAACSARTTSLPSRPIEPK